MPATPDQNLVIIGLLNDIKATVTKLATTGVPVGPGGTAPTPPTPPAIDEAAKFHEKWKPVTAAEFKTKYGVELGKNIPQMTAYDEAECIYRARAAYNPKWGSPGQRFGPANEKLLADAINVIAHATQETAPSLYETGYGLCDPDVAAFGFYLGIFKTMDELRSGFNIGTTPRDYAGQTIASIMSGNFVGGNAGPGIG